jgi:hypothetical protein
MSNPEIKQFIRENSSLFWHIPDDKKEEISKEVLVETILNYGDMKAVGRLLNLLGINEVADIFFRSTAVSNRRKGNYHELTLNFFTHLFRKYAH